MPGPPALVMRPVSGFMEGPRTCPVPGDPPQSKATSGTWRAVLYELLGDGTLPLRPSLVIRARLVRSGQGRPAVGFRRTVEGVWNTPGRNVGGTVLEVSLEALEGRREHGVLLWRLLKGLRAKRHLGDGIRLDGVG